MLDNWEARVNGWGPQPLYRAPTVGFTYRWDRYEYLWVCLRGGDGGRALTRRAGRGRGGRRAARVSRPPTRPPRPPAPPPQYAATYGSWGWKSPPMGLTMFDSFGNKLVRGARASAWGASARARARSRSTRFPSLPHRPSPSRSRSTSRCVESEGRRREGGPAHARHLRPTTHASSPSSHQTWEVYSARVFDYRFYGNSWGK